MSSLAALALLAALAAGGGASEPATPARAFDAERCPLKLQLKALASVGSGADTWRALFVHWRTYGTCDAGPVREGYGHGVVGLLTGRWERLGDLALQAREDRAFLDFVLAHLDASAAPEDLERVRRSARQACPRGQRALCRRLERRADEVLHSREAAAEAR